MKNSRIFLVAWCLLLIVSPILVSCGTAQGRSMTIMMMQGQPEILKKGTADWNPIMEGMQVKPGDTLRTGDQEYIWAEINDGSVFGLGRETEASLVTLSKPFANPVTLIDLANGMVFVTVTKSLGEGSFEVHTPLITAGVVGSKMAVDYDKTKSTADIACLEGTVTGNYGDDTASPQVDSGYILGVSIGTHNEGFNADLYKARPADEVYNEFNWFDSRYRNPLWGTEEYRQTQESQLKTQRVETFYWLASITPTPYPTEEPTATEMPTITSTPDPLAKLKPTITVDPDQPLSAEEQANSGIHDYSFTAVYSGECYGSTSGSINQMQIQFNGNQVILSDNSQQSYFDKVDVNTYQAFTEEDLIIFSFTLEGFFMEQANCVRTVYTRE